MKKDLSFKLKTTSAITGIFLAGPIIGGIAGAIYASATNNPNVAGYSLIGTGFGIVAETMLGVAAAPDLRTMSDYDP